MASLFCCGNIQPFRPKIIDHELKFRSFLEWARYPRSTKIADVIDDNGGTQNPSESNWQYAIQLVQQVNYGPLESKRYFVPTAALNDQRAFLEITERDLINVNFAKVNSYKNFKCTTHNKFFEFNLYQKDPVNRHHWRVNIARPSAEIDLDTNKTGLQSAQNNTRGEAEVEKVPADQAAIAESTSSDTRESTEAPEVSTAPSSSQYTTENIAQATHASSENLPRFLEEMHFSNDLDDFDGFDDGYRSENSNKDYTACSLEDCGYCGHCDY